MEPLSPKDPVYRLLGKTRPVEPRGDFTQNVLRAVRQLPQHVGLWERLQLWLGEQVQFKAAAACAVVILACSLAVWKPLKTAVISAPSSTTDLVASGGVDSSRPSENDVASELDTMNQLSALLAQQDTNALSDSDIAFLLY